MTKVVILAGGKGARMGSLPKPLTPIGGLPIVEHVMRRFAGQGYTDFIVVLGDGSDSIREYEVKFPNNWQVEMIDTGAGIKSASRVKRIQGYLDQENFFLAYCDCLNDIDLAAFHQTHIREGKLASMVIVNPPLPFGVVELEGTSVVKMQEKPIASELLINAGTFLINPAVLDLVSDEGHSLERDVLPDLAGKSQLTGYVHSGYWKPVDTQKDAAEAEEIWNSDKVPWAI